MMVLSTITAFENPTREKITLAIINPMVTG
jgi:hypothetical protein